MERNQFYETKTILVTVKTYPTPSAKYIETTCVSGITEDGHWIRLHPINFRSLEDTDKFPRYSRICVRVNKSTRDIRPESYHLDIDRIEQLGVIPTTNNWEQRRAVIEPLLSRSVEDLQDQNAAHGTSLGVIRPKEITRFLVQETAPSWLPEQLAKLDQQRRPIVIGGKVKHVLNGSKCYGRSSIIKSDTSMIVYCFSARS